MGNLKLKVSFLGGIDVKGAAKEAKDFAISLNIPHVGFNFNGVELWVRGDSDIEEIEKEYLKKIGAGLVDSKYISIEEEK